MCLHQNCWVILAAPFAFKPHNQPSSKSYNLLQRIFQISLSCLSAIIIDQVTIMSGPSHIPPHSPPCVLFVPRPIDAEGKCHLSKKLSACGKTDGFNMVLPTSSIRLTCCHHPWHCSQMTTTTKLLHWVPNHVFSNLGMESVLTTGPLGCSFCTSSLSNCEVPVPKFLRPTLSCSNFYSAGLSLGDWTHAGSVFMYDGQSGEAMRERHRRGPGKENLVYS